MENKEIYIKLKDEVLETYPPDGINIIIPGKSNYSFQLTNSNNEQDILNNNKNSTNNMIIIDLKDCETLLRKIYSIERRFPLIF